MKKSLLLLVFSLFVCSGFAQWTLLSNDYVPNYSLASFDSIVLSGIPSSSGDYDLAISTDGGDHWSGMQLGSNGVSHLLRHGPHFYAATPNGIYRASVEDMIWESFSNGISGNVMKICGAGDVLVALVGNKVYKRSTEDVIWVLMSENSPVTTNHDMDFDGNRVVLAGYDGIAESIDLGLTWTTWPHAQYGFLFDAVGIKGDTIVAASKGGMYRKLLSSGVISEVNNGLIELWSPYGDYYGEFEQFHQVGNTLFVCGQTGVYKLSDNSWYWEHIGFEYSNALTDNGTMLFAANGYSGIWGRPLDQIIVQLPQDIAQTTEPIIFPNPVQNLLTIRLPIEWNGQTYLTISNQNGRQLIRQLVFEKEIILNVADWAPGMYFVTVTNSSEISSVKFIKSQAAY